MPKRQAPWGALSQELTHQDPYRAASWWEPVRLPAGQPFRQAEAPQKEVPEASTVQVRGQGRTQSVLPDLGLAVVPTRLSCKVAAHFAPNQVYGRKILPIKGGQGGKNRPQPPGSRCIRGLETAHP